METQEEEETIKAYANLQKAKRNFRRTKGKGKKPKLPSNPPPAYWSPPGKGTGGITPWWGNKGGGKDGGIKGWMPGMDAEKFVVSANITARKK